MGHGLPNMVGADGVRLSQLLSHTEPEAMVMGTEGMGEMATMRMPVPENSTPMRGGVGPFGSIDMGGMFTLLRVREKSNTPASSEWFEHPARSVAGPADPSQMYNDGVR